MEFISQPWAWYVAGPIIAFIMFLLLYSGKRFGMSSNLVTICAIGGGSACSDYFKMDIKSQRWNLVVVLGSVIGGFIAMYFLTPDPAVDISVATVESLKEIGIANPGSSYVPDELFGMDSLTSPKGILILLGAGFLVGFGARYAGGCTSGHAISGLSNLQLPSLIAVIGFFIGGLIMTNFILPYLI